MHYRNEQRGEFTVGVSNEESNRGLALSFEPSCVRREGLSVDECRDVSTEGIEYSGRIAVKAATID